MNSNAHRIRIAAVTVVCVVTFYVSFSEIMATAMSYGIERRVALAYPISIDALILVCAFTLIVNRGATRTTKVYAKFGRLFGFGATIYCNSMAAGTTDINALIVHAIPAVSLIFTVELLVHGAKGTAATRKGKAAGNVTPIRKTA